MTTKDDVVSVATEVAKLSISKEKVLYNKTKVLLRHYRKAVWSIKERIIDTELDYFNLGGYRLNEALEYLDEYATNINKKKLEEDVCSLFKSKYLIDIVDKGLSKIKKYPECGKELYRVLYYSYIHNEMYPEDKILDTVNYERTTYYKKRRRAISLLGTAIWGIEVSNSTKNI